MQCVEDEPWRNLSFERAARSYKATTGVGCHGIHYTVPLDISKETKREVVKFIEKVEQCGSSPQEACRGMIFLIPKNRHRRTRHCSAAHSDMVGGAV